MTGLTAKTFRLKDRGRDRRRAASPTSSSSIPATIIDRATYEDPRQFSAGIDKVFVNGTLSWEAGATTVRRNGRLVGGRTG